MGTMTEEDGVKVVNSVMGKAVAVDVGESPPLRKRDLVCSEKIWSF